MNLPQLPWLADASLRLSLVLALFLIFRPWLRRFAGSVWLNALWLVLLARLLAPWPLATPLGLEGRAPAAAVMPMEKTGDYFVRTRVEEVVRLATIAPAAPLARAPFRWDRLWLAGAGGGLVLLALRAWRTRRFARQTEPARDARLLRVFAEIPEGWRCGVELRETDALSVPTLAGLIRPQIWMPRAWLAQLSDAELRHVLLHELGHARRRDLLVQWLFALAVCVHWFNPLVWLAARLARADREMACDAWVLARSESPAADEYGATLLKTIALLRAPLRLAPHAVAMAASRRGLFTRIASLGAIGARPAWRGVLGLLVLGGALVAGTTTRLAGQAPAEKPPTSAQVEGDPKLKANPPAPDPAMIPGLSAAGAPPQRVALPQIEVSSRFVEITDSATQTLARVNETFAALFAGKVPPTGSLTGVLKSDEMAFVVNSLAQTKGVEVLSTPRVTTKSGQRAVIEIIREFRYPTEFDRDNKTPPTITPTAFETRNLGVTLEVEPILGADGHTIDLNLTPQVVELTGYNRIGPGGATTIVKVPTGTFKGVTLSGVGAQPGEILQPIFSTRKITTNVSIFDGQTIVIGGLRKEGDIDESGKLLEPRQLVVFITASTVERPAPPAPPVIIESKFTEHTATGISILATPKVATRLGQQAVVRIGDEKRPMLDATFLAQRAGDGRIEIDTTFTRTDAAGARNQLDIPKLKLKPGQPASVRIGDYEVSLTATLPELPASGDAATARPVPGKPGFVASPYAPDAGYIDVRGFPPGTEVKCPYTGKIFVVP